MNKRKDARVGRIVLGAQNPLLRSLHMADPPAAGLEVLDDPITGEETQPELKRKSEKLYAVVRDLVKYRSADLAEKAKIVPDLEKFRKASEKIEESRAMAVQALELARAGAGTVPGDGRLSGRATEFMRVLARGSKPDREFCELARVQEGPEFTSYFHLVSHPARALKSLGVPDEVDGLLARFRLLNDVVFMLNKYFSVRDSGTYQQLGGMAGLGVWKEWTEVCKRVRLASDLAEGAAATGGAWVPTIWSGNLIQLVQIMARCANYFETFPMQSQLQKGFVEGADAEAFYIAEGGTIEKTDFTTFDATWTAKKLASRIITNREINQDSGVPMVQEIERKLSKSQARGWEKVVVNGQATGSSAGAAGSLDTGETMATADARLLTNGLRYWHAQTGLGVVDANAGLTIEAMAKVRGPMGAYGTDPSAMIWLCSAWGAAHILTVKNGVGQPIVLGPRADAAPPAGTVGRMLDSDIVLSSYVSDAMNSSGVIDGAGATTTIYYPNTDQFKTGERLGIIVEASAHELFSSDRVVFKAVRRVDFQPVRTPSASEPMIGAIGNLPLS
jgi:HK97 family phage major capsid protein